MGDRYSEVAARTLTPAERGTASNNGKTPLVIEPKGSSSLRFLERFLKSRSDLIVEDIARHGAVLLRGFDVPSSDAFEQVILSIEGMRGIAEVLMSEPGRDLADGTRFVLHTNTLVKTGGGVDFMQFHCENFYLADVPRFISFFCLHPSSFGGETGLVDMAGVYADLSPGLRARLEEAPFLSKRFAVRELQERYGLSGDDIEEFCASVGLPVSDFRGLRAILIYKPCVVEHPITGEKSLVINVSGELEEFGFGPPALEAFKDGFSDPRWSIYRLVWKHPWLRDVPGMARHPISTWHEIFGDNPELSNWEIFKAVARDPMSVFEQVFGRPEQEPRDASDGERPRRIGFEFDEADVEALARSVRRNFSSFGWRKNDVLMIDNLKTAHTGMPGFGKRELRAMICNPTSMGRSAEGPGLYRPPPDDFPETLGEKLMRFKRAKDSGVISPSAILSRSERP